MTGNFVTEAEVDCARVNRLGRWYKPWFYRHVRSFLAPEGGDTCAEHVEYVPPSYLQYVRVFTPIDTCPPWSSTSGTTSPASGCPTSGCPGHTRPWPGSSQVEQLLTFQQFFIELFTSRLAPAYELPAALLVEGDLHRRRDGGQPPAAGLHPPPAARQGGAAPQPGHLRHLPGVAGARQVSRAVDTVIIELEMDLFAITEKGCQRSYQKGLEGLRFYTNQPL